MHICSIVFLLTSVFLTEWQCNWSVIPLSHCTKKSHWLWSSVGKGTIGVHLQVE